MMNRIIFDCERMKYENTGLYHYCLNLGNHVQKIIDPTTEELSFYTPPGMRYVFEKKSKQLPQNPLHKFYMPVLKNYKVWHATYQDSYYLPMRNKSIKVILTIHDLNFMYDFAKSEEKKRKNLNRLQELVNRADILVCISEHTKKDVLFYCEVNNKPVHVIYNGTNMLHDPALCTQSYKPKKPFLFSLGTITRKKNVHALLPLINNDRSFELVIAGRPDDSDYCNQIINTARQMKIIDKVHLLGQITENEKSWYFKNCSAFVFPSTAEGFGLPVAEAMSMGKPLFLSNKTALPEIGGKVAFYFKDFSVDNMQQTFDHGMKQYHQLNMQDMIIKKGKEFCWEYAAIEYHKIYRSLY